MNKALMIFMTLTTTIVSAETLTDRLQKENNELRQLNKQLSKQAELTRQNKRLREANSQLVNELEESRNELKAHHIEVQSKINKLSALRATLNQLPETHKDRVELLKQEAQLTVQVDKESAAYEQELTQYNKKVEEYNSTTIFGDDSFLVRVSKTFRRIEGI